MANNMHNNHGMSINDICKMLKISRASFYRYINLGKPTTTTNDQIEEALAVKEIIHEVIKSKFSWAQFV